MMSARRSYSTPTIGKIRRDFIAQGVIPVVGTKSIEFEGKQNTINLLLAENRRDYNVPLWTTIELPATLPGRGLWIDNVHMGPSTHDYTTFPRLRQWQCDATI